MPYCQSRKIQWLFAVILLGSSFTLTNCRNDEKVKAPSAITDTIPVTVPTSTFHIPITYEIAELEEFLNGKIQGKFLETIVYPTKNEKEQVRVELSKVKNIQVSAKGDQLVLFIPLFVKATILKTRVNLLSKGIKPVETEVHLQLTTPVDLDTSWQLQTKFILQNVKWVKPPVVRIAGINFDLTKKIDEFLDKDRDKLCTLLDNEIHKAVSLRKPVEKVWTDLQKPIIVNKKPPRAFLRFITQSIAGDLELTPNDLVCHTEIESKVAMVTETKMRAKVLPLPAYQRKNLTSAFSKVSVYAFAEFDRVNDFLSEKIVGKSFSAKGLSASIANIQLYGSDSGLSLKAKTAGDLTADLVATVRPEFDSAKQAFYLKNFQFDLASSSTIVDMGSSLLHEKIQEEVQKLLVMQMDSLILKVPDLIMQAIGKGKTGRTIDVNMEDLSIHSCAFNMDAMRLHILLDISFNSAIKIKQLNAGKKIFIRPKKKGPPQKK